MMSGYSAGFNLLRLWRAAVQRILALFSSKSGLITADIHIGINGAEESGDDSSCVPTNESNGGSSDGHSEQARLKPQGQCPLQDPEVYIDSTDYYRTTRRGMYNLGNTCFFNSVIQALASCPAFVYFLDRSLEEWETPLSDIPFTAELQESLHLLVETRGSHSRSHSHGVNQNHVGIDHGNIMGLGLGHTWAGSAAAGRGRGGSSSGSSCSSDSGGVLHLPKRLMCSIVSAIGTLLSTAGGSVPSIHTPLLARHLFRELCSHCPTLSFDGQQQQDAHECLQALLDVLGEELELDIYSSSSSSRSESRSSESISRSSAAHPFQCRVQSYFTCNHCSHTRALESTERMIAVSLPIPTDVQRFASRANKITGNSQSAVTSYAAAPVPVSTTNVSASGTDVGGGTTSSIYARSIGLEDCLRVYCTGERIEGVKCPHQNCPSNPRLPLSSAQGPTQGGDKGGCGSASASNTLRKSAVKSMKMSLPLPSLLCLHVSRRTYSPATCGSRGGMTKILSHVEFPLQLDLREYCDSTDGGDGGDGDGDDADNGYTYAYALRAVVEHSGTADYGHYSAYVREGPTTYPDRGSGSSSGSGSGSGSGVKVGKNDNDKWSHASDQAVQQCTVQQVLAAQAFLLFYERC